MKRSARARAERAVGMAVDYGEGEKLERLDDLGYLTSRISFLGF